MVLQSATRHSSCYLGIEPNPATKLSLNLWCAGSVSTAHFVAQWRLGTHGWYPVTTESNFHHGINAAGRIGRLLHPLQNPFRLARPRCYSEPLGGRGGGDSYQSSRRAHVCTWIWTCGHRWSGIHHDRFDQSRHWTTIH